MRVAFDNSQLELVSPTSPDNPWSPILEKEGEGMCALALKVSDIDEAIAELEVKGLRLDRRGDVRIDDTREAPDLRYAQFKPEDSYGVRIELVQYEAIQPAGIANSGKMNELLGIKWDSTSRLF